MNTYDEKRVDEFFKENGKISRIIRAHEVVDDGYDTLMNDKVITVFSATNYCGRYRNAGGILILDKSG